MFFFGGSTKFCSPICYLFVNQQKPELTIPSFLKIKMIVVNTNCFRHFLAAGIAVLYMAMTIQSKGSYHIWVDTGVHI